MAVYERLTNPNNSGQTEKKQEKTPVFERLRNQRNEIESTIHPVSTPMVEEQPTVPPISTVEQPVKASRPGRDIPVIGHALRALDAVSKVSAPIAEYTTPDAPMIGQGGNIPGTNAREAFLDRTGHAPATGAAKVFGQVAAPFAVPGAGLGAGVNLYKGAGQALAPIAPKLGSGLGGRVAQGAITGSATGAPMAAGIELAQGTGQLDDAARQGVFGAVLGGAADAAIPAVGSGIKKSLQAYKELPSAQARQAGKELLQTIENTELPIDLTRRNVAQGSRESFPPQSANQDVPQQPAQVTPVNETALPIKTETISTPAPLPFQRPREPVQLDELVRSKGHQEVNPESIAQTYTGKTWYHGTGTEGLTAESLYPFGTNHEGLFGQGVYLTDNPTIAEGYAKSRGKRTGTPTIYQAGVNVDKVIDLEKPLTTDVGKILKQTFGGLDNDYNEYDFNKIVDDSSSNGDSFEKTFKKIQDMIGEHSADNGWSKDEYVEYFQELLTNMKKAGFDGVTHTGGARTGNDPHRVLILIDPNDMSETGRAGQVTKFEKYAPPVPNVPALPATLPPRKIPEPPAPLPVRSVPERIQGSGVYNSGPSTQVRGNQTSVKPSAEPTMHADTEVEQLINNVQQPRVRDRVYSYLDEAEKAARKRLAAKKNTLSSLPIDQYADHAVIMAAKIGKGAIKATDFAEELVKEFGEQIRPHADRIFQKTKNVLRQQERRASKEGQEARAFNESGTGDASSFDKKISRDVKKNKVPFRERWEKIRSQFTDDLAALEGLEKRVKGSVSSAEDSLYKSARMFKGTPERAGQIVRERLSPIVESIEKSGFTADDLGRYALAKHAQDVNAADMKSGFTNSEIEAVLNKFGSPEMEAAQQALIKVNRDMLKELVKSGVVSRELADTLNERWKNYVPLFRSFEDDKVDFAKGMSGALANVASPIQKLKGSERAVIDPLENMVKNIFQSINAAERNKVAQQLSKLAKQDKDSLFIRKLESHEDVGRKNVVNVKVNGENVKYEVEPEVYKAMLNLDQESSNMLMNILAKPASLLRAGATLTPEFSLRNPMRDVLQAFVTSESGFNPITDFTVGLIQSVKKGDLYKDWVDNLGAYGNVISMDRDVHRQALEKVLKQPAGKTFVNVVNGKGFIGLLRAISDTTESATKVGEYRAALRKGATKQEAAYRSRDIMDFARAGSSIRQANRIVAFLNANIQGKSKLIRAIKANPVGTTTRMFTAVTLPTVAIYASNYALASDEQKKSIADAPNWQRDTFWLVAIPGTDKVARIPKPFDIAPIFANLPERALQFAEKKDPDAFEGFVRRTLSDSALPAQITGLWPFIEGMANYSFFREGPIIPQREQGLKYKDQYDPIRTTESAKLLAAGAEKLTGGKGMLKNFSSPRIMDSTIKGLTAGLGTYATSAIDTVLDKTGLVDRPTAPQKKLEQRPLAKAFLVDPLASTKSLDKFYEEREKLSKDQASAKINEREFKSEAKLKVLDASQKLIGDISKAVRTIESNTTLSAKEKREKIDKLNSARNDIARKVMDKLKNVQ